MTTPSDIPALAPLPSGAAVAHARGFSTGMGALAGGSAGLLFGSVWGLSSGRGLLVRTATLAAIGSIAGALISHQTWASAPRLHAPQPAEPNATKAPHAARIEAERAAAPETAQAL